MNPEDQRVFQQLEAQNPAKARMFLSAMRFVHDCRQECGFAVGQHSDENTEITMTFMSEESGEGSPIDALENAPGAQHIRQQDSFFVSKLRFFLEEMPEDMHHQSLTLHRDLLRQQLKNPQNLEDATRFHATVMPVFSALQREYSRVFIDLYATFSAAARGFANRQGKTEKILFALQALGRNRQQCQELLAEYKRLCARVPSVFHTNAEVADLLRTRPVLDEFSLEDTPLTNDFEQLPKRVDAAFSSALGMLKRRGIQEISGSSLTPLRKMLELLKLSKIEEIADILHADRSGRVAKDFAAMFEAIPRTA